MVFSNSVSSAAAESPRRSRETVFLISLLLLILLLAFTAFFSRMYKKHIHVLADEWFAQGQIDFQAGNHKRAVVDFRNALAYSPDNPRFQFQLAKALSMSGREDEAKAYLQTLLSEAPGSGDINLELARIAVREGQLADAMRYFQGAIYGEWSTDPILKRWQVRGELCEYLINRGAIQQVEGELIALVDNTPSTDRERLKEVGVLLLRAQFWARALNEFQSALALNKEDAGALKGAGTAAFQLGRYASAREYLERLPPEGRKDAGVSTMIETSQLYLELDPFPPDLAVIEKVAKTERALAIAQTRLQACAQKLGGWNSLPPGSEGLQRLYSVKQSRQREWSEPILMRHPERVEPAMEWVFEVENESAVLCGTAHGENDALWLLGRSRGNGGK